MTQDRPRITTFKPVVLTGNRRVTLEMAVEGLPTTSANVMLMMPDMFDQGPAKPTTPPPGAPSPYPNIELSILDSARRQVASLFVIEHKEPYTSLTLHLRAPDPQEQYTARAEMSHQGQTLEVVEVPFSLFRDDPTDE